MPRVGRAIHFRPRPGTNQPAGFKPELSVGAAAGRAPARGAASGSAGPAAPRRAFPLAAESTRSRLVPVAVHYCIYSQLGRSPPNLSIVQMLGLLRVGYTAASYHHRHAESSSGCYKLPVRRVHAASASNHRARENRTCIYAARSEQMRFLSMCRFDRALELITL